MGADWRDTDVLEDVVVFMFSLIWKLTGGQLVRL